MNVLIACEFSGIVRDAFTAKGHNVFSCDLLPTELPGKHIQGNVLDYLSSGWDMLVAHPPCTNRCNSGVRWLKDNPGRLEALRLDDVLFNSLFNSNIPKICIENPIPHKYSSVPKYTQIIQPWQFGVGETKSTCLWLKGLPKLEPTNIVSGRKPVIHYMSPGVDRWKNRSRTYPCFAKAMVDKWG